MHVAYITTNASLHNVNHCIRGTSNFVVQSSFTQLIAFFSRMSADGCASVRSDVCVNAATRFDRSVARGGGVGATACCEWEDLVRF